MFFFPAGVNTYRHFYINHQLTALAVICLLTFYSIGYFVGMLSAPDERAIFQFARLSIFALFLPILFVAARNGISTPQNDLMVLTLGVTASSLGNWGLFLFGNHLDPSLPGQNVIGQNVALFFSFFNLPFFKRRARRKKFLFWR